MAQAEVEAGVLTPGHPDATGNHTEELGTERTSGPVEPGAVGSYPEHPDTVGSQGVRN